MVSYTRVRRYRLTDRKPGNEGVTRTRTPLRGECRVTPHAPVGNPPDEGAEATWENLVCREPRLAILRAEVEQITAGDGQRFCANECWYGFNGQPGIKPKLVRLVGWHAENPDPVLHTMTAYAAVYEELYALLPDCWDCDCAPRWVA